MNSSSAPDAAVISQIVFDSDFSVSQSTAEAILQLHFSAAAVDEIRRLREKNAEGTILPEEYKKLDSYRRAGQFLDMMQAQAKSVLRTRVANP